MNFFRALDAQLQRPLVGGERIVKPPALFQDQGQIEMGIGHIGLPPKKALIAGDRLGPVAELTVQVRQSVAIAQFIGRQFNQLLQAVDGFGRTSLGVQRLGLLEASRKLAWIAHRGSCPEGFIDARRQGVAGARRLRRRRGQ